VVAKWWRPVGWSERSRSLLCAMKKPVLERQPWLLHLWGKPDPLPNASRSAEETKILLRGRPDKVVPHTLLTSRKKFHRWC